MLVCPTCSKRLYGIETYLGPVYLCKTCSGRAVTVRVLARNARPDFLRRLRSIAAYSHPKGGRPCPLCTAGMAEVDFGAPGKRVTLDVCDHCKLVWFDPAEYEATAERPPQRPRHAARPPAPPPLPTGPGDDGGPAVGLVWPDKAWKFLPGIFGLPIEFGPNSLRRAPVVTWTLSGVMAALLVWLLLASSHEALSGAIGQWGMIPSQWMRHGGLTLLTSFFLHAGWFHLVSNVYFLLVFGDNVEDRLGRLKFIALLAVSHLVGLALHAAISGAADVPCVGASAGISGVIAYYAIVFPRARVGIFLGIWTLFHFLRMPALAALVIYAILQAVGAYLASQGSGASVAYLAHLGGLAAGALAALASRALEGDAKH